MNLYNDNDPYVAKWLGNLVTSGHLPQGAVNARSIVDIEPTELRPFRQCHFFAGIGGWPYALQIAGWSPARSIWTGSCPCQPFSAAGRRKAGSDERHLWPEWLRLIRECRPDTIIGEQVEGAVGFGWLDRVFADLEAEGYACGAAVLGAHSVGAPHIRQRLFWVADASEQRRQQIGRGASGNEGADGRQPNGDHVASGGGATGGLGDADRARRIGSVSATERKARDQTRLLGVSEPSAYFWGDAEWLPCLDGKSRRIESGTFPLAHGVTNRVGRLRAYGNAIVPQVAAEFVRAFMEAASLNRRRYLACH